MKAKIKQPEGINYLIQDSFWNKFYAQEYIDMLIEKSEKYIMLKKMGCNVAPLMTVEQLETQLANIRKFEIVEVV